MTKIKQNSNNNGLYNWFDWLGEINYIDLITLYIRVINYVPKNFKTN